MPDFENIYIKYSLSKYLIIMYDSVRMRPYHNNIVKLTFLCTILDSHKSTVCQPDGNSVHLLSSYEMHMFVST